MRRTSVVLLSAVVLLGTLLLGGGRFAVAQEESLADHLAVGSWAVESDPGDAGFSLTSVTLAADGTALYISPNADVGVGVWAPSGETTASLTFRAATNGPAYILIRVGIEVPPDGVTFTGTFTAEMIFDPAGGGTSGQIGPGSVTGTRMLAEAPGTPTSSFEEFFAVPGATPEATPVS